MQFCFLAYRYSQLTVWTIQFLLRHEPHDILTVTKHILHHSFHTHVFDDRVHITDEPFFQQIDTCHFVLVLYPKVVMLVKINMIMSGILRQRKIVFGFVINVYESGTIVEVDMPYCRNDHTARLRTHNSLRTIICQTV